MNILYVIAMNKEALDIVEKLQLSKVECENLEIYRKNNISLLIAGIGKQRTAINTTIYLENNLKPDLIINVGYVGATKSKIGEWYQVNKSFNYEWDIPGEEKYTIPEFEKNSLINLEGLESKECYSAESFVNDTKIEEDVLFDMELYSLQILCNMYDIKLLSLKKVSDCLNLDEYYKNLDNKNVLELSSCLNFTKIIDNK